MGQNASLDKINNTVYSLCNLLPDAIKVTVCWIICVIQSYTLRHRYFVLPPLAQTVINIESLPGIIVANIRKLIYRFIWNTGKYTPYQSRHFCVNPVKNRTDGLTGIEIGWKGKTIQPSFWDIMINNNSDHESSVSRSESLRNYIKIF